MKKILFIFILSAVIPESKAQLPDESLSVTNLKLTPDGHNNVEVAFNIHTAKKIVGSNYTLILMPELTNNAQKIRLSPVMIEGRNAVISRKRQSLSDKNIGDVSDDAILMRNGEEIAYATTIPYQNWMEGSTLQLAKALKGCCDMSEMPTVLLAENISILRQEPKPAVAIMPGPAPQDQPTTGDLLAGKYLFISSESERAEDFNSDKNAIIYFRQSEASIDRSYRSNKEVLDEVAYVVRTIEKSEDSKITRVLIAGFASPEGALALNEKLGMERAAALKRFILDNSDIKEMEVSIHNGVVDWDELKKMVEASDLKEKNEILTIINNVPVWSVKNNTGRLGQLMKLNKGKPYQYMFENFFPLLRSASYIRIYYKNLKVNNN